MKDSSALAKAKKVTPYDKKMEAAQQLTALSGTPPRRPAPSQTVNHWVQMVLMILAT